MWMLHVVVVRGGTGWPSAMLFGLVACGVGWQFAWLAGESRDEEALTLDLLLAGAGAALGQLAAAAARTDPLATVFGVHLFSAALGALLLLSLAHDLALLDAASRRRYPLPARGGLLVTFLGLSSWPEDLQPCASYASGLRIALLPSAAAPATLLYEVRFGLLRGMRRLALPPGATVRHEGDALVVYERDGGAPLLRLAAVTPVRPLQPR